MTFTYSPKVQDLQKRVTAFMEEHVYPAEPVFAAEMDAARSRIAALLDPDSGLVRLAFLHSTAN